MRDYTLRYIKADETPMANIVEQTSFPPNEACKPEMMAKRVDKASDLFLVAIDNETGEMAGFLTGLATSEDKFRDEFFTDISLNDSEGKNVMLLSLAVMPDHRMQGLAKAIVLEYVRLEKEKGREKLYLTCLEGKVQMYTGFGFMDLGVADSNWGGEEWHEMVMEL